MMRFENKFKEIIENIIPLFYVSWFDRLPLGDVVLSLIPL